MSDTANISADAIAALLSGLASALTEAQQTMAEMPPADSFGRPLPSYRIPELDFTFEIETVEAVDSSSSGKGGSYSLLAPRHHEIPSAQPSAVKSSPCHLMVVCHKR